MEATRMDSRIVAAGRALANPDVYTDEHRLHDALTLLRREAPVSWVEPPGYRPFWAITRHSDVVEVERAHDRFLNAPRPVLRSIAIEQKIAEHKSDFRTLIHMDNPDHRVIRAVGAAWFRPRALNAIRVLVCELAKRYVDRMLELDGTCDFVTDVAKQFPLYAILSLLGLPKSDYQTILTLTQEMRGNDPGEFTSAQADLFDYFHMVANDRISSPTEDLASAIANTRVNGERLSDRDIISYYVTLVTAGHDTLSSVMAGGLQALIENPDQLCRLQQNLDLMPFAVDEMIRWVTPTKSFMRTASVDHELQGVTIRAGDSVLLNYASANRDEDVFVDPFRFDVGRDINRHLAFGYGVHYCLGAKLAKIEIDAFFVELLTRLHSFELAGQPLLTATTFVGGLRSLPIRYESRN
jgi:cytochrome P450